MSACRRLLALLLVCCSALLAHATTTYHVGPGQQYPTIQSGINAASAGDFVVVAPGIYYENIDFNGKAITVLSSGGAAVTTIDGSTGTNLLNSFCYGAVNFHHNEVRTSTISGFTIRGGAAGSGGVCAYEASPSILNNNLTLNTCNNIVVQYGGALIQGNQISAALPSSSPVCLHSGTGAYVNGIQLGYGYTDLIGNTFESNPGGGAYMSGTLSSMVQGNTFRNNTSPLPGAGLMVNSETNSILQNLFYGNTTLGVPSGLALNAGFSYAPTGGFWSVISGNTIADGLSLTGYLSRTLVVNNLITTSSATGAALQCSLGLTTTPPSLDHNDLYNFAGGPVYGSGCTSQTGSYGNLSADPAFASPATGNYQLTSKSPALDAGNSSAPQLPTTDFAGQPRIQGATNIGYPAIDIGAYEYAGTADTGHTAIALTPSEYFTSATPNPPPPPLTFAVQLSSAVGQPTGYAAIYEDATLLGTVQVGASGTATFTPGQVAPGLHSFTAVYPAPLSGGVNSPVYFTHAVSPRFYLLIPAALPSLTLTSAPNPSMYGGPVTFSLTTNLTGPITLTDTTTSTLLATLTANASGVATYTTTGLIGGSHSITASVATSSTQGAASATLVQVVSPVTTQASLAVLNAFSTPVPAGTQLALSAVVLAATNPGIPTGVVTYLADNVVLGTAVIVNGRSSLIYPIPAGQHTLSCTYSGDNNFAPSTCGSVVISASSPSQTITFPPPPASAYAATAVALQASSSAGLPITYTVVSGPATVAGSTLTYAGAGTVVLQADQPGDATYPAATPVQQTVNVTILTEPLNAPIPPVTTLVTILSAGTLGTLNASTQGAAGLDFSVAPGGTCSVGATYAVGQTCTVAFTFTPLHPGLRYGGITLATGTGTLLANSYLLGLGTGPQVLYNPPNQTTLGLGFSGLSGVAVDGAGNIDASDYVSGGVYQISAATGATRLLTPLATGVNYSPATDVAVDGSGNVFYTTRDSLLEILAVNGIIPAVPVVRTIATNFGNSINGMKVDALGNAFIASSFANGSNSYIEEVLAVNGVIPATPVIRTLVSSVGGPTGVAIDIAGDVFFSDENGHTVYELVAVGGILPAAPALRVVSSAFSQPTNVSFDVSGNLYVPDAGTHNVQELLAVNLVLPASPTIVSLGAGLTTPAGVTIDSGGSLFVADLAVAQVVKLAYGSAPTLNFAATQIGQTSADSPRFVTITNGGNAPLNLPPPATGTNPVISTNFSIGAASTCPTLAPGAAPASLAAAASCTTAVNFTPTTAGNLTGTLVRTDNNLSVPGSTQTIVLNGFGVGIPPTIVFTVPNHTFGDAPFTVGATSNSPGAITYSVLSGPATIAGTTVTLTGAGSVTLQASQVASGIYAAGTANATFLVAKKAQTITFAAPLSPVAFSSAPIQLVATASSGLPVTFSVVSGPGQISGSTLTIRGGGTIVIAADQPGDTNFAPAPQVTRSVTVLYGIAAVTLSATPNPAFLRNPVTLTASVTSPAGVPTGLVTFQEGATVLGSSTLNAGSASIAISTLSLGNHTITAVYQGDANYALAPSPSVVVTIQDFSLTITNPNVTIQHGGVAVYNIVVTSVGGAGLASTINLTFTGGPDRSESTLTPATIATGSGTSTATLTMRTPNYPTGPFAGLRVTRKLEFAALFGALLIPAAYRRKRWKGLLLLLAATVFLSTTSGCGSGWKTQHFNVTVTATSGPLIRTAQATLVSQP